MKITYLHHDGFLLEDDSHLLLFDYWKRPFPAMDKQKPLFVFVSHHHEDHYNPVIWKLHEQHPHTVYVVHEDIIPPADVDCVRVSCENNYHVKDLNITTLFSTDAGCAFLVELNGRLIYHAGDLNWWHWEGEPQQDNQWHDLHFHQAIAALKGKQIDIGFLPLDPRQEHNAWWGFLDYLKTAEFAHVFPMHFGAEIEKMQAYLTLPQLAPYLHKIQIIHHDVEAFTAAYKKKENLT